MRVRFIKQQHGLGVRVKPGEQEKCLLQAATSGRKIKQAIFRILISHCDFRTLKKFRRLELHPEKRPKGEARKVRIARRLRVETAVTLKWIAEQLHMGTWTHVVNRLQQAKEKSEPNNQHELRLV